MMRMRLQLLIIIVLVILTSCSKSKNIEKEENLTGEKEYNEVRVKTEDGIEIAFNEFSRGNDKVVIICHGITQYKDSPIFTKMAGEFEGNYDVIVMDFRGHGKSEGRCTLTSLEVYDLKAIVDYARERYKKVGVIGFSLGAATSILTAATYKNIDSLIVVSSFTNILRVNFRFWKRPAIHSTKNYLNDTNLRVKIGNVFLPKKAPIRVIDKISPTPVLFLHGTKDWVVDISHSYKLYEKAEQPKKIIIFENGYHAERLYEEFPEMFIKVCLEWFKETL